MNTVLIVEDSRSQRECISHQLRWSGMNVVQACDGVEALEKIQSNFPDVVLLDLIMPRLDGYEVCRLIKANPETCKIPVVFLTGKGQQLVFDRALKNAEAYVNKPWHPRELLNTIKHVLLYAQSSEETISADAWIDYGILILSMIKMYECRADAWTKYSGQIIRFYDAAMAAFQRALNINPDHAFGTEYRDTLQKKWEILLEKLEQTKPCKVCRYYYGKDGLNCAVHPCARPEELCRDWEFN